MKPTLKGILDIFLVAFRGDLRSFCDFADTGERLYVAGSTFS
jgi:hypothetical protein